MLCLGIYWCCILSNVYGRIVAYVVVREFVFWVRRLLCWETVVVNRYGLLCKLNVLEGTFLLLW